MSRRDEVLVSTDWVAEHVGDPAYRLVEVDEDTAAYAGGHIATPIAWHWKDDLHEDLRREFLAQEGLTELLRALGRRPRHDGRALRRQQQLVRHLRLLAAALPRLRPGQAGGRRAQEVGARGARAGRPTSRPYDAADPGALAPVREDVRAFRDDVLAHIGGAGRTMVDVRSPAEFSGEVLAPPHLPQEQAQVPGHIPGAANVPWASAAADDGSFKSDEELTALYGGVGVTPETDVIAYCRIGERSSHTWFVLHELLGYPRVRNYDGSWTEYGSLVGVPVER